MNAPGLPPPVPRGALVAIFLATWLIGFVGLAAFDAVGALAPVVADGGPGRMALVALAGALLAEMIRASGDSD